MKKNQLFIALGFLMLNFLSCKKIDQNLTENTLNLPNDEKIHSIQIDSSTVLVKEKGGKYYFADDIILSPEQFAYLTNRSKEADSSVTSPKSGVISQFIKTWTGGTVPYIIASNFPNQQRITDAISHYNAYTTIRLIPRTNQPDYVVFTPNPNVSQSYIGRVGGGQTIDIWDDHQYGSVIHEIGHAIGLFHEHTRSDRDDYINLDYTKIPDGTNNINYQKVAINDIVNIGPFDFNSIMMYGSAIDQAGTIAMRKKDGSTWGSQRSFLTDGDINGINYMYQNIPFVKGTSVITRDYSTSSATREHDLYYTEVRFELFQDQSFSVPYTTQRPLKIFYDYNRPSGVTRHSIDLQIGSQSGSLGEYITNRVWEYGELTYDNSESASIVRGMVGYKY